jgi:hypothetical protein
VTDPRTRLSTYIHATNTYAIALREYATELQAQATAYAHGQKRDENGARRQMVEAEGEWLRARIALDDGSP